MDHLRYFAQFANQMVLVELSYQVKLVRLELSMMKTNLEVADVTADFCCLLVVEVDEQRVRLFLTRILDQVHNLLALLNVLVEGKL